MTESHDPMCSVPLSYLTMLQERREEPQYEFTAEARNGSLTRVYSHPSAARLSDEEIQALADGVTHGEYERIKGERDRALERIAAFEERAGCKLEHIPVEALGDAQNAYVSQQAIDTLKAENEALCKRINELSSRPAPKPVSAPWGVKKDGTPKKRPGRKAPRKRAA